MIDRKTRRKFGQNYLKDPAVLFEMGEAINPSAGDHFFEIGPGMGALTKTINNDGVNIFAMDVDPINVDYLKKKIVGPANLNFKLADVMTTDLGFLKNKTYRVIGNLPYNISTQIILKLLDYYSNIYDMHFLVQKEVAEKIASTPSNKDWGKLALKIGSLFSCQILFDVPPDAFDIKPKVNSSFIRLSPKSDLNISASEKSKLFKVIDMAFVSRRKNIRNNLKNFNLDWSKIGVDPTRRPEDLCLKEFLNISKNLEY